MFPTERLLHGVRRFRTEVVPGRLSLYQELANGQRPQALFIACADSRVAPELITQADPGEIFTCRNAGNIVPPYGQATGGVSAAIEYAVMALKVRDIVVCGHSDCGAMKGILHPEALAGMPTVRSWLNHAEVARRVVEDNCSHLEGADKLQALAEENVLAQLNHLRTHPSVATHLAMGDINLHGWVYSVKTREVIAFDADQDRFVPLGETAVPAIAVRRRPVVAHQGL